MLQKYEERLVEIKKMLLELGSEVTMSCEKALSGMESLDASRFESARMMLKNAESQANAIDNEIVVTLALFGPEANRSAEHIVGHDPRVEQIFYQSISLVDFSRYDAYFDVSGLITLPRWNDLSAVDWYLWWFGVDPSQIPPASKRNKLFIPWFEWMARV